MSSALAQGRASLHCSELDLRLGIVRVFAERLVMAKALAGQPCLGALCKTLHQPLDLLGRGRTRTGPDQAARPWVSHILAVERAMENC